MASGDAPAPPPPDYSYLDQIHTVMDALLHWSVQTPDRPVFIFRAPNSAHRSVLTYGELYQLGGRWASVLHAKGVGRGHLVVNTLPNSPERAVVESAILLSGAASVNGVCQLRDGSDLKATLRKSAARAVVLDPDVIPDAYSALLDDVTEPKEDGAVTSETLPALKFLFFVRRRSQCGQGGEKEKSEDDDFLTALRRDVCTEPYHNHDVEEGDICTVFTTSGTTGFSKLAVYTHENLLKMGKCGKQPPSVEFLNSPLGWVGGHFGISLILYGRSRVLYDARAGTPTDMVSFIYKGITEERAVTGVVPMHLLESVADMVDALQPGTALLRMILIGSQIITRRSVAAALRVANLVLISYGSTENVFGSFSLVTSLDGYDDLCAGTAFPGITIKILGERGEEVKADTRGDILIKSPYEFSGYLNDPQATNAAHTEDGFFRTGDVGWLNSQGQLYVEGRSSDAIMRGSYVFYPGWIESRIRACSSVRDVVVVGVPDAMLKDEICACVMLKSTEMCIDDVKAFVDNDVTGDADPAMSPRPRHYLLFDSFPMTDSGKVRRAQVKEIAAKRLADGQPKC